jgi:carboxypeptidase Q
VAAIESDNGTFSPRGFRYTGSPSGLERARRIAGLLQGIQAGAVQQQLESPGADIAPLVERGVPGLGLDVEQGRYFWFHHSEGDTLDKVDPAELARCVAALAVMAYVIADLPEALRSESGSKPEAGPRRTG